MPHCEKTGRFGICNQQAIPGSKFCQRHTDQRQEVMSYRFTDPELKERMDRHSTSKLIESVREEVVLVRSLIEERRNFAQTQAEKIKVFPEIIDATSKLERLVTSLARLERQTSQVLEKPAIQKLGKRIVEILTENLSQVPDRDNVIDRIAREIADAVIQSANEEVV
jgi:hypothetical protein